MKIQLAIFTVIALAAASIMAIGYVRVPAMLGIGKYTVTVELPRSGGLYATGNVTYRGVEVGRITAVELTATGVKARLLLNSDIPVPADVTANVHSQTAVGEQFIELVPRSDQGGHLKEGSVIPAADTTVPPDINSLLDATNTGLEAIPQENLRTAIDESYTAFGGLGPELSRLVKSSTTLAIDARKNLDAITTLIDQSQPILDSQAETANSIQAWAANTSTIASQLRDNDAAVSGVLAKGGPATDEVRQLFERLKPTLPILLANLVSVNKVAVAYQPAIEQLLVFIPQAVAIEGGIAVPNKDVDTPYKGLFLSFNLNLNLPPVCSTGYLPRDQQRSSALVDAPDRTQDSIYCRIPQDSNLTGVRGARNLPCLEVPGKRAPTVAMCDSDEQYVPLNDGTNWKGDPNATLTGQPVPQPPPGSAPTPLPPAPDTVAPPLAVTNYDPKTGSYVGPDGKVYLAPDLAEGARPSTWQGMLVPGGGQ